MELLCLVMYYAASIYILQSQLKGCGWSGDLTTVTCMKVWELNGMMKYCWVSQWMSSSVGWQHHGNFITAGRWQEQLKWGLSITMASQLWEPRLNAKNIRLYFEWGGYQVNPRLPMSWQLATPKLSEYIALSAGLTQLCSYDQFMLSKISWKIIKPYLIYWVKFNSYESDECQTQPCVSWSTTTSLLWIISTMQEDVSLEYRKGNYYIDSNIQERRILSNYAMAFFYQR